MSKQSKAALTRSRAAKKGWETRARNARSLAAKKGWETRRARKKKRKITPRAQMWRVTVSAPYFTRGARGNRKKKRGSITASYMVRGYFKTEKSAQHASAHLREIARKGRNVILENNKKTWWRGSRKTVNEEIRSVPFDARLLDIVEEENENLDN